MGTLTQNGLSSTYQPSDSTLKKVSEVNEKVRKVTWKYLILRKAQGHLRPLRIDSMVYLLPKIDINKFFHLLIHDMA